MTYALSASEAGALAQRARLLHRRGLLTHAQFNLMDRLLWTARRPGSGMLTASLAVLARIAGQARSTAIAGIKRLEELGLLSRIRRRVKVAWGGSVASRQVANAYVLRPEPTETDHRSGKKEPKNINYVALAAPNREQQAAQEALAERRRQIEARLWHRNTSLPQGF